MRILALGAHPDDIELGMGATLHKLAADRSNEVNVIIFSRCEDAVPSGWKPDSIVTECSAAFGKLGESIRLLFLDVPNKQFQYHRQQILDGLYPWRKKRLDMVFTCSTYSSHQDHNVVTDEAKRAFRGHAIYGYCHPYSDYGFSAECSYSVVSRHDVKAKLQALQCYKSQFKLKRPYFDLPHIQAITEAVGWEIGRPFAEKFQNIRGFISW